MDKLNKVPSSERTHIGIFGRSNSGKSSIINALTNQNTALVSPLAGTTTDPVSKSMELLPLGPVVITDTAGLDDTGELGKMRVERSYRVMDNTDIALLVVDINVGKGEYEENLIESFIRKKIPYILVYNKCDDKSDGNDKEAVYVSAENGYNIDKLREKIASYKKMSDKKIVADLIDEGDFVILVVPIDESAPKGRLILPQQQTIRDILDSKAVSIVTQPENLLQTLSVLNKKPKMVITDSQAFEEVSKLVPEDIYLTSFSILFARYKGELDVFIEGVKCIDNLKDKDKVLIAEGCTHRRQCGDIGSVKIPAWIKKHTGKDIIFEFSSGNEFYDDLSEYSLVIHCGGCMINEREMYSRMEKCKKSGTPIVNYGMAIAYMKGILKRSIEIFADK